MNLKDKIDIAAGRKQAKLVLKNCRIVNVLTQEIVEADIAIEEDTIIAIGNYDGLTEVDVNGKYVTPGFIDGHVHIESAMVTPSRFAQAVVPCGTTSVIADPHEIANVCGRDGIAFMADDCKNLPLDVHIMLPSCVPATGFEEAGAILNADALKGLYGFEGILGLGEVMSYPLVTAGDEEVIRKIETAGERPIDGHAPRLTGKELAGYVISGAKTDHECATTSEMQEKFRLGMYIHIRSGSACQEIKHMVKGITPSNMRRAIFCTDDRHPHDILASGHINYALRLAVANGLDPIMAVTMATLNTAECYTLKNTGAVAPGYKADLVILEDLKDFNVWQVYKNGKLAAQNGKALFESNLNENIRVTGTVRLNPITENVLKIKIDTQHAHVIQPKAETVETIKTVRKVTVKDGYFQYDKNTDICKLAVFERHTLSGHVGLGLVEGFGIKEGAIAQTISHDSHNIIAVGDNDVDITLAVNELAKNSSGGIVLVHKGAVAGYLELPIAGLMSLEPLTEVDRLMTKMERAAREKLKIKDDFNPFMVLGFLALPVIPEIRVTPKGLFDVTEFKFIDVAVRKC